MCQQKLVPFRNKYGVQIIHLEDGDTSACRSLDNIFMVHLRKSLMTSDVGKVTCGRCRKTSMYKALVDC